MNLHTETIRKLLF